MVKLDNPTGGVKGLYDPKANDWIQAELKKRKVSYTQINTHHFEMKTMPDLFEDADGKQLVILAPGSGQQEGLNCVATGEADIITVLSKTHQDTKICYLQVRCSELMKGQLLRSILTQAVCKPLSSGECPDGNTCYQDPEVTIEKAQIATKRIPPRIGKKR